MVCAHVWCLRSSLCVVHSHVKQAASREADVVVVGAGVAGLACCMHLAKAGVKPLLLEAGDGVGGRVRTDKVR